MKWGKTSASISTANQSRKAKVAAANAERDSPKNVTTKTKLKGDKYKVKTKGGQKQPVTDDAIKAHVSRQKLKKSGVDALSNDELRDMATRMNLEQQVNSLSAKRPKSIGRQFVEKAMEDPQSSFDTASTGVSALKNISKKR
jgi:ferredoxin-fold anticodon binding domain-containing protein